MPVESLHARKQLAVIPTGDQDLGVGAGGGLEDGERTGCELMFFDERDFVFTV